MITPQMLQVADLWRKACEEARVESGHVYFSIEDEDISISVHDREGGIWRYVGGGSDERDDR